MSKHAATGRKNQTGTILRRRDGDAAGRHRARPARWAALVRSARRALLGRAGRMSVFTRFGLWTGFGDAKVGVAGSVLAVSALAVPPRTGRPEAQGAGFQGAGRQGAGRQGARPWKAARAMGDALRRSSGALRQSVARVSRRARELGIQWAVQAGTRADAGMSTAEYAVGTIAACGFAALLWKVVTSAEVRSMLAALIQKALKLAA
ncbi:DUF4244 domain-containing protein [Microbispora sp. NPDC046973]|uniref:DUF4244 domain-containing protein n=1 Tax=Microbispora sp. NPDC046973 TaxID=3155022 RepID=UPI0033D1AC53